VAVTSSRKLSDWHQASGHVGDSEESLFSSDRDTENYVDESVLFSSSEIMKRERLILVIVLLVLSS
jgi:hypothetical protein